MKLSIILCVHCGLKFSQSIFIKASCNKKAHREKNDYHEVRDSHMQYVNPLEAQYVRIYHMAELPFPVILAG